jgi:L-lysine exporter family protein LysE/ArgO
MSNAIIAGLTLGLSLIVAIGAQNAFVLKQGLKKSFVLEVCLICALSDTILISLGVFGFGKVLSEFTLLLNISKWLGFVFLFFYGGSHFYSAFKKNETMQDSTIEKSTRIQVLLMCLGFTWLNPHVYLDTVVLIGSISAQYGSNAMYFGIGTIMASWIFFFALGYGARLLGPIFKKAIAWKILDVLIGILMWLIAYSLVFS